MDTLKFNSGRIKMIAHRGLSGIECENTAAAFVAAGNRRYFGIETDVHQTADGKYIIIHDDTTGRVAGDHYCVEQTDFDTLRRIRLMDIDGKKNRGDLIMPTLEEYFSICKRYEKTSVLELKNPMSESTVFEIAEKIKQSNHFDHTIIISFSLENLLAFRKKYPAHPAQYLVGEIPDPDAIIQTLKKHRLDLDAYHGCVNGELVKKCHQNGIAVNVWTVDSLELAQHMAEIGVDYITTDILE